MTQDTNSTTKDTKWVLYIHRWGHTVAIGLYDTVEEAQQNETVLEWDAVWNQTHSTGYCGYAESLPMYPRMGEWTPYFTLNQDGEYMYRLMNPVERLKMEQAWNNRSLFSRFKHWIATAPMYDPDWRSR